MLVFLPSSQRRNVLPIALVLQQTQRRLKSREVFSPTVYRWKNEQKPLKIPLEEVNDLFYY